MELFNNIPSAPESRLSLSEDPENKFLNRNYTIVRGSLVNNVKKNNNIFQRATDGEFSDPEQNL